jgi:ABC-2 type transport system ATP-binding protein
VLEAIRTIGLRKVYPAANGRRLRAWNPGAAPRLPGAAPAVPPSPTEVVALAGLDLTVAEGEFFGLLGPNGAGKTTTIGILTTRVRPTSGTAIVAGADVVTNDTEVRLRIGVVPQRPNADRSLNVRENLLFHAAYFGIPRAIAARRAMELLDQFGIGDRAEARVDQLSGGQQQRLMIARALIHEPRVVFLDEPTVGLDPQARLALWEILRALHAAGRTIVMTTHYMEEADRLCDRIAIVDRGRLLAVDTPARLKAQAPGGTLVELSLDGPAARVADGARTIAGVTRTEAVGSTVRVYTERGGDLIPALIRVAEEAGRGVRDIHLSPPSLETLFISLTGRKLD